MKSFALTFACLMLIGFTSNVFAGEASIYWADAGSTASYSSDTINSCGAPRMIDIRVTYSDSSCPIGFGANPYRFTVSLYRDGALLSGRTFQGSACWFNPVFNGILATPGNYYATVKLERRLGPFVWVDQDYKQTEIITAAKLPATLGFTINGASIPLNGSPVTVNIANPIILNGSGTTCATKYLISVEESDIYWGRTYKYEWAKWFDGSPSGDINLQKLATNYSVAPDWLGNDPTRQGTPLFGGNLPSGSPRYYRVGLCTMEPSWACHHVLLRVE